MNKIFGKIINFFKSINDHYSTFVQNNKILHIFPKNIYLLIVFVIMSIICVNMVKNNETLVHTIQSPNGVLNEIIDESISLDIDTQNVNRIDKIGLYFATYSRKNNSTYYIKIYEDDKLIHKQKFNSSILKDNKLQLFNVNIKNLKKDKNYKLELFPHNVKKGSGITVTKSSTNEIEYSIVNKSDFSNIVIIISIIFLIIYMIVNIFINNNKIKNEKMYFILMLIYILPILFLTPPLEVPDETYHFYKSYKVSQYSINKNKYYNMNKKITVPKNYNCLTYSTDNNENVLSYSDINNCLKNNKNIKLKRKDVTSTNRLFVTIPGAIGIKVADTFTNSPIIIFYLGRLCSFIVSFLILLKCFDILPKHKSILLLLCCIPVFIQQTASYSYDGFLNSLCLLLISFIFLKIKQKSKLTIKHYVFIILVSVMIMAIKLPYVLILGLTIFIDNKCFGEKKRSKWIKLLLMGAILITLYFIIQKLDKYGICTFVNNKKGTSIGYLISNPKLVLVLLYNTIKYRFVDFYFYSLIGIIGCFRYHISHFFIICYYIVLLLTSLSEENKLNKKIKIVSLLIFIAITGLIVLAMLLSWTNVNTYVIEGVQGRYFLPILPLLLVFIIPKTKKIQLSNSFVYSFINISMIVYIISILVNFY